MAINTVIIDHEILQIKKLKEDLMAFPEIKVIDTTTSIENAKRIIRQHQPNLVFLGIDINGPGLFNEIRLLAHPNMCVVFYSAFDKHIIEALRASAFDYLSKSYSPDELRLIIGRFMEKIQIEKEDFRRSKHYLFPGNQKFALYTITCILFLYRSETLYFQYSAKYRYWQMTLVNMTTHKLRLSTTAKEILSMSTAFIQVSQNCILNMDHLASIENKTLSCILYPPFDHLQISASRRYYSKIKEMVEIF